MSPVQVNEASFENDGVEKRSLHDRCSSFPEDYARSFGLDSFVMMRPAMIIAAIKSAKVMKTPENPKAKIRKAMVQSVICNPFLKNGKIVLKPLPIVNGRREIFGNLCCSVTKGVPFFPLFSQGQRAPSLELPDSRGLVWFIRSVWPIWLGRLDRLDGLGRLDC